MDSRGSVTIQLLGPPRVAVGGAAPVRFPTRKVEALFGMIALAGDIGLNRDAAAALLWSRSPEGQARANLRQALAGLRRSLGAAAEIVIAEGDALRLDPSNTFTDTRAVADATGAASSLEPDWLLQRGPLLEGLDLPEPPFEDWIALERQHWTRMLCDRLIEAAEAHLQSGSPGIALALAERLVRLDDLNEAAHRLVMRALLATGEDGAALRYYEALRRKLREELDIAPGEATAALAGAIRTGAGRSRTVGATATTAELPAELAEAPLIQTTLLAAVPHMEPRTELRTVVVLVGRMPASAGSIDDPGHPQVEALAFERRKRIVDLIEDRGGMLLQNTGTGFRAVFGARAAHSHDAERAVACGVALLEAGTAGSASTWRLAATAGRVLVEVAEDGALSFLGDPLDRADDLLLTAENGRFVVDQAIHEAAQRLFAFEPAGSGAAWRVGTRVGDDIRSSPTAFVGRDADFARLQDVLENVALCGEGEVVLLRGEAGIGKSRLCDEVAAVARTRRVRVIAVGALDFGASRSEGLVARLAQALAIDLRHEVTVLDKAILADLIGRDLDIAEREMLGTVSPAARAAEQARVLGALLTAAAGRSPLLIVVEDLHWATRDVIDLLADLAAVARELPVTLLLTTRPQDDPVDIAWRRRCAGARIVTIDLAPLRKEAARRLVASLGEVPDELIGSCLERAQGNPLFLEHLARSASRSDGGPLPLSVQSVVQEELDQLSSRTRHMLRAAAVLGQVFAPEALEVVSGLESATGDELRATGLVVPRGERLGFIHALVRDGIYASIPARDRTDMHRRAADWFEPRDLAMRAEHLDRAGDPRAAGAYLAAARAERRGGRPADALRLVERALGLVEEGAARHEALLLRADVLADLERYADATDIYRGVIDAGADAETLCASHLGLAESLLRLDRHDEGLRHLDEAERLLSDGATTSQAATIPYLRSTILFSQGAPARSVENARIALPLAQRSGDRVLEARALSAMADAEQACGRFRTAERAFAACAALSDELGLRRYALVNRKMCADLRFYDADFGTARAMLEQVRDEAQALGSGRAEMLAEHMLAYVDCAETKYDDALMRATRGRELVEALKAQRFLMNNACYAAMALWGLGRPGEALKRLIEAETTAEALNVTWIMPWVLAQRALCEPEPQGTVAALKKGEALISSGAGSYPLDFYRPAIDAAIRIGDWQRVQAYADALTSLFAEERVGLVDLLIRRAQLIASAHLDRVDRSQVAALIAHTKRIGYLEAIPALEEVLRSQ